MFVALKWFFTVTFTTISEWPHFPGTRSTRGSCALWPLTGDSIGPIVWHMVRQNSSACPCHSLFDCRSSLHLGHPSSTSQWRRFHNACLLAAGSTATVRCLGNPVYWVPSKELHHHWNFTDNLHSVGSGWNSSLHILGPHSVDWTVHDMDSHRSSRIDGLSRVHSQLSLSSQSPPR